MYRVRINIRLDTPADGVPASESMLAAQNGLLRDAAIYL